MSRKNKGLTLVEVLVAMAILSILVASLHVVFQTTVDTWTKAKARLDIVQNARVILEQLSRELPGAFVDDGAGADFIGADGLGFGPSDTLEFVTFFAGKIYNIKYELLAGNILRRQYDQDPGDYNTISYTDINFGFMVDDIQFYYLAVLDPVLPPVPPAASIDWKLPGAGGSMQESWDSSTLAAEENTLPEAIKIVLDLRDSDANIYTLETIVYLPNSTSN